VLSTARPAVALAALAALVSTGLVTVASPAVAGTPTPSVRKVIGGVGPGDGGPFSAARLNPSVLDSAPDGSLVMADSGLIRVVDGSTKVITTVAGGGGVYPAEGVLARNADLSRRQLSDVAISAAGEVSFAWGSSVFTITSDGLLTSRTAGNRLAYAPDGTLILLGQDRLYAYSPGSSSPVVVAGGGASSADGVAATDAALPSLADLAVDAAGSIYVTDYRRLRKIAASDHTITTVAGTLTSGSGTQPEEGAPATTPLVPGILSIAPGGDLEFLNGQSYPIQLTGVTPGGTLHRLADPACGFASFVSRADDVLFACNGLRSLSRAPGTGAAGVRLAPISGHSTDDVPAETAWSDGYDSIARLAAGELALASSGDLQLLKGSAVTTHHEDGYYVDRVAAAPGGQVMLFESSLTSFTSGRLRILSADGLTATTLAGGGSGDPTGPTQPATSASLQNIVSLAVTPDGTAFLADSRHVYAVTPAGDLVHVAGFTTDDLDAVGLLAVDPRDGSLVIDAPKGVYRRDSATGALTRIYRTFNGGSFAIAPDGSFLLGNSYNGLAGTIDRYWPDGSSARIAGHGPDGLDPLLTNLSAAALAVDTDGTLLVADNAAYPVRSGEVRDLDLTAPERPAAPTTGAVTGDGGVLTVTAPAPPAGTAWEAQVKQDGSAPISAADTDGIYLTSAADGSVSGSLRKLVGTALTPGRTYAVRLSLRSLSTRNRGPGEILTMVLQPDTTPPGPVTDLTLTQGISTTNFSYTRPTDVDFDHVELRFSPGTVPPATVTDGDLAGRGQGGGWVATSPAQPYAFAAFAVDFAGNTTRTTALLAAPVVVNQPTSTVFLYAGPSLNGSGTQTIATSSNEYVAALRYAIGSTAPELPDSGTGLPGGPSFWTQPDLAPGTTYSVSAFTFFPGDLTKVTRITKTFTTGTTYQAVQPVTGLTTTTGIGTATLTWASANPVGTINVLRSSTGQELYVTGSSYVITHLTADTDYAYSFRSYLTPYTTGTQGIFLHGTHLTMASPGKLTAGKTVTLRATLLHGSTPVLGRTVTLYVSGPKGTMVPGPSAKTGAGGVAVLTYKPISATLLQPRFLGAGTDIGSVGTQYYTEVLFAVSLKASALSGKAGRAVTLTATVAPATARLRLTYQQLVGRTWKTVGYGTMNAKGVATVVVRPPRGRTSYRVVVPYGRYNTTSTSSTLVISGS
jgi:hypothetical protein